MSLNPALFAGLQDALLHSLWHGLLVAIFLAVVLRVIPAAQAERRYGLAVASLAGFLFLFMVHWSYLGVQATLRPERHVIEPIAASVLASGDVPTAAATSNPPISAPTFEQAAENTPLAAPPWLLYLWAVGAGLMLLRMLVGLRGVRALVHASRPAEDLVLAGIFEELRAALGVTARVALRISTQVAAPMAVGLLWPTVVLPASLLSGMPTAHVRALLAHELAHIRRYDYLVNFLQLLAEAAFYFNPALWWISRQIRIEREACCDALAARHAGSAIDYAAALVAVARQAGNAPTLALAADGGDPAGVPERARRILLSTYRPALHYRWYSLAAGLAIVLALGGGLYTGTHAAADAMVTYLRLNDAERVEYLREADKRRAESMSPEDLLVTGRVLLPDGTPCQEQLNLSVIVLRDEGSSIFSYGVTMRKGKFRVQATPGDIYVQIVSNRYAPTVIGPLTSGNVGQIEFPDVVLSQGIPLSIRVEDLEGAPVPQAEIQISYIYPELNSTVGSTPHTTDDLGIAVVPQGEPMRAMSVRVEKSGFEPLDARRIQPVPGEVSVVRLKRAVPLRLRVTRGAGGPLAEGVVCYLVQLGRQVQQDAPQPDLLPQSDGTIGLANLPLDDDKLLLVRDPGFGSAFVRVLPGETGPVEVALQERFLEGNITGDLSLLEVREGQPGLTAFLSLEIEHYMFPFARDYSIPVDVREGVGYFRANGMVPGRLTLFIGGQSDNLIFEASRNDYTFNLIAGRDGNVSPNVPRRRLDIALASDAGEAIPEGNLIVELLERKTGNVQFNWDVPINHAKGQVEVPVPANVRVLLGNFLGYRVTNWKVAGVDVGRESKFLVEPGEIPLQIEASLEAAGAIRCEVVGSDDGLPLSAHSVRIKELEAITLIDWESKFSMTDGHGIGWLKALEFDRTYTLMLEAHGRELTRTVKLSRAEPIAQVRFEVPPSNTEPTRKVRVSVLDPDGIPLTGFRVLLNTDDRTSAINHGVTGMDSLMLSTIVEGATYHGVIAPDSAYAPVPVTLGPQDAEVTVQAKPGRRGEGRVLLQGSDEPLANVEVSCQMDKIGNFVSTFTDAQGRFRFSNLPEEPVKVDIASLRDNTLRTSDFSYDIPLKDDGSTVLYLRKPTPEEISEAASP